MHQPLAGFLVRGIKIHEGRTWYTAHRGRFVARPLWPFSTLLTLRCPSIVPRCVDYGSQPLRNNPPTTRLPSGKRLTLRSTPVRQTLGPSFSSCLVARVPTPLGFFSGTWQTIMGRETPHPTHNLYAQPSLFAPAWFFFQGTASPIATPPPACSATSMSRIASHRRNTVRRTPMGSPCRRLCLCAPTHTSWLCGCQSRAGIRSTLWMVQCTPPRRPGCDRRRHMYREAADVSECNGLESHNHLHTRRHLAYPLYRGMVRLTTTYFVKSILLAPIDRPE